MIEILAMMAAVWLLMVTVPDTPIGRLFRMILVERPAARLNRLSGGHLAMVALLGIVIGTVAWIGEGDGIRMLAMAAPEAVTWLTTFEIAAYLDVAMAAIAAWSATRFRLPALLAGLRALPRHRDVRPRRSRPMASNDDEEGHPTIPSSSWSPHTVVRRHAASRAGRVGRSQSALTRHAGSMRPLRHRQPLVRLAWT